MTTGSVSRLEQGWSITAQRTLKYEVTFVPGLITRMARPETPWLASNPGPNPRVVVVDRNVLAVYESEIRGLFDHDLVRPRIVGIDDGERSKRLATVTTIIDAMNSAGVHRLRVPMVVIGGGVALDTAGFAASIYRRGVTVALELGADD